MRRVARSILVGFSVVALCAAFIGACSNQGEGDRCQGQNGNEDCADGLECSSQSSDGVCCPPDRSTSTSPACRGNTGGPLDSSIPNESSTGSDAATDTGTDAAAADTGAGTDAADASTVADANDDGG